ncbi:MAG: hypothetical protein QY322_01785 [bacterium]|nr:MAG: hypothetical protein QY322_01785 [bacterium]
MLKKALNKYLIGISLILLIGIRFIWLNSFPVGMDADQFEVALSSKTIANYSVDSSGTAWYKSIFSNDTKAGIAGFPSLILSPIYKVINGNLTESRLIFVLINLLTILFISFWLYELTQKKDILVFYITLFVGLINPWLFTYSRLPTEAPFALLMIMLGSYILTKFRNKKIFYSLPFFIAGFYSYFGSKPILLILVPILLIFHYVYNKRKNMYLYLVYLVIFVLTTVVYFIPLYGGQNTTFNQRSHKELIFLNPDHLMSKVNEYRKNSIDFPYKEIIINKYTFTGLKFTENYIGYISSDILFWKGDLRGLYTFEDHGLIYLLDLLFIVVGIYSLRKYGYVVWPLALFFVLAPVPSALSLNGDSYFYRSFLLVPSFIILIALGIYESILVLPKKYFTLGLLTILFTYLALFVVFLIFYFFRYPIRQHSNNFVEGRLISSYVDMVKDQEITVLTTSPYSIFNELIFYNRDYFDISMNNLSKEKSRYEIGKVLITDDCSELGRVGVVFLDSKLDCVIENEKYLVLQNQSDSGVTFKIFNDRLCNQSELAVYRRSHLISDYHIEKMTSDEFCNRWIQNGKTN